MLNNRIKILTVFGTRPEVIKLAPIIQAMKNNPLFDIKICTTGQHQQMINETLTFFGVQIDYDLNIMQRDQSLTDITIAVLKKLEPIIPTEELDYLMVQGDTNSAFASALAAFYQKVAVIHIEAGLRTGNPLLPWPEEINRKLIASVSSIHFAATKSAENNLLKENFKPDFIFVSGNTVIDTLLYVKNRIEEDNKLSKSLESEFSFLNNERKTILITGHRREHWGEAFKNFCKAIQTLAKLYPEVQFVYPVHLNPRLQSITKEFLSKYENVYLLEPLDYVAFVYLMNHCYFIITDSGGIQEEAPSLGKPVLVTRDSTERIEGMEAGNAILVGKNEQKIVATVQRLLSDTTLYKKMSCINHTYGDGQATQRILDKLIELNGK